MSEGIGRMVEFISGLLPFDWMAVVLIALMPFLETRLAIPFGLKSGMSPLSAFGFAFIGSTLAIPILLACLLSIIRLVARLPFLRKIDDYLVERFDEKASFIFERKIYLGLFAFSALPLPLTGVYSSCLLAVILKANFFKALLVITLGNLVSAGIIIILCYYFSAVIDLIIIAITIIALIAAILLLIKSIIYKKKSKK